jgi:uncharacterized repeat protein (TIGR02543 family)
VNVTGSGSVIKNPDQAVYAVGDTVELTAVPATGWTFDGWSGDATGLENPITVTVNSDMVVDADFALGPAIEYTLDVTLTGSGQVVLNPPGGVYSEGTTVELTAVGDPGWQFSGWNGDLTGSTNPAGIIMTKDYFVGATFDVDTIPPVISNIEVNPNSTSATITWTTNEPATSAVEYGQTTGYELGLVEDLTDVTSHTITLTDLIPGVTYHYRITSTDRADLSTTTIDQVFNLTGGPFIDFWYGTDQNFGHIGISQRWVNILGNVSDPDGVDFLRYSLNGGPNIEAMVRPDTYTYNKRLENPGDFNIEIAVAELVVGVNQLNLIARDLLGNESVRSVTINYENQNTWPSTYSIDWNTAPSIPAVAQIVDGLWTIEGNTVRTVEPGFDRLIAIGDIAWTDYEVTVPVMVHWIDEDYTNTADAPNVGLLCRWQGHTEDGRKPSLQWWPLGTFAAYRWWPYFQFQMFFVAYNATDSSGLDIDLGVEYIYKLRAETISNQSVYKLKVWRSSDPEPVNWLMDEGEGPYDLKNGSIMLVAHNADVSFGEVTIVPIQ